MPYYPKGKCVYKKDTDKKVGCTEGPVKKYLAALYTAENKKRKKLKESFEEDAEHNIPGLTYDETLEEFPGTITIRYKVPKEKSVFLKMIYSVDEESIKNVLRKKGEDTEIIDIEKFVGPEDRFVLRDLDDKHSKGIVATNPEKDIEGKYGITKNDLEYCINIDVFERIKDYFLKCIKNEDTLAIESFEFEKLFDKILNS